LEEEQHSLRKSQTWTLLGSGNPALASQESKLINKLNVRCGCSPFTMPYAANFPKFRAQREEIRSEQTLERRFSEPHITTLKLLTAGKPHMQFY